MKKPLMIIPPAQAEALYDAALEDALRGRPKASVILGRWADEWADDDLFLPQPEPAAANTHERHSSSKSSR